jgi:cytochrome c-type biogenesis protein CcmH
MKSLKYFFLILLLPVNLHAIDSNPIPFDNPEQEQRYQQLTQELRCVVCQNQSVADSNADLAQDIRKIVRQKILAGKTDAQIALYLVERYGDFVLYNPPLKPKTYFLWLGPSILLLMALIILIYFIRRHTQTTATPPTLTAEEREKITPFISKD